MKLNHCYQGNAIIEFYYLVFFSLQGRFDDLELNELLDDIRTHMNYQY